MSMIKKIATAGAVATLGLGLGAASASAYAISGGSYTSTASASHTFTVGGGVYTIGCTSAVFNGSATGSATTNFTPTYTGCDFFGFPATVAQSGNWSITVTSGGPTWFYGDVNIPAGTTTTINVPLAGCTVTVSGAQTFQNGVGNNIGQAMNYAGGTELDAYVENVAYTASGCPFSSAADGTYDTGIVSGLGGPVQIPGVTVS